MVDREGRQKLAEVVTEEYGLDKPTLVYYNENTGALIVGNHRNKYIRVFKTTNM
ncbi:hypothetical protein DPMN_117857 [Dreissena polymorpha]|nr:hypothetical protein DPMN_117857 [Dreissena polymorpha]